MWQSGDTLPAVPTNGSWDERDSGGWGASSKPSPALDSNVMGWGQGGSQSTSSTGAWGQCDSQSNSMSGSAAWGQPTQSMSTANNGGGVWGQTPAQPSSVSQPEALPISSSPQPLSSWAAAAGKGLNPVSTSSANVPQANSTLGPSIASVSNASGSHENSLNSSASRVKNEEQERLKSAALSADNWGQAVINQESSWNLPPSPPQSAPKVESAPIVQQQQHQHQQPPQQAVNDMGRSTTGTEIWESAVRVKTRSGSTGSVTAPSLIAAPQQNNPQWAQQHTPATHIGGTWGEEEDQTNVWSGIPPAGTNPIQPRPAVAPMGWGEEAAQPVQPAPAPTVNPPMNTAWNQPPPPPPPVEKKWTKSSWGDAADDSNAHNGTAIWGGGDAPGTGSSSSSGSKHSNHGNPLLPNNEEMGPPSNGFGTWSPVPRKDSNGWEEDGSGDKRNNLDDGTAVWGNPVRQPPSKMSGWKEGQNKSVPSAMPPNGITNGNNVPRGIPSSAMDAPTIKNIPDSWSKSTGRATTGWGEGMPHRESPSSNSSWGEAEQPPKSLPGTPSTPSSGLGNAGWGESQATSPLGYGWGKGAPPKQQTPMTWADGQVDTSTWSTTKQGKPLSKDMIQASMQFRILTEKGFKKEDVENALRASGMVLETALEELRSGNVRESNGLDGDFSRMKHALMGSNSSSLLNTSLAMPGSSLATSIMTRPTGPVQAQNTQSIPPVNQAPSALTGPSARPSGNQAANPWANQLLTLVQQIQLAVHDGHLNAQILNQPLAPTTLGLLYSLLQQIKELQSLQENQKQLMSLNHGRPGNETSQMLQNIHVRITRTKQAIINLQNQIAAQQATFLKHQSSMNSSQQQEMFPKANESRPVNPQEMNQGQSRLSTWKMPSFDKPDEYGGVEFNRQASFQQGLKQKSPATDMMNNWSDGASSSANANTASWSEGASAPYMNKPKETSPPAPNVSFADLVPEFEPGKPWKGTSTKNVEDDPTITPGSLVRPALSLAAGQLGNWSSNTKATPTSDGLSGLNFSATNTWSFGNPSTGLLASGATADATSHVAQASARNQSTGWNSPANESSSDMWGMSMNKPRGPPPGLSAQMKPCNGPSNNIWNDNSNNYLLRNLNQQMDGTLDAMVMQHPNM